jgi:FkbM family methyltransferase
MSPALAKSHAGLKLYSTFRKYLRVYPAWWFAPPRVQVSRGVEKIGSDYGGYFLDPSLMGPDAVVYSLGVGEDISFDLALIERFGLTVYGFDPTPKVKTWLASQSLPLQFHFLKVGIADFDGEAVFYLPPRQDYISHSLIRARQYSRESIRVPMIRMATAMRQLGHTRINVLKMDIEGAEYGVIENLVQERIPVEQILVEFHHRLSSIGVEKTRRAIALLREYGLEIAHICPRAEVFTFLKIRKEGA